MSVAPANFHAMPTFPDESSANLTLADYGRVARYPVVIVAVNEGTQIS